MGFETTRVFMLGYLEMLEQDIKLIEQKLPTIIEKIKNMPDEVTPEQIEEFDNYLDEVFNMLKVINLMGENND